MFLFLDMFQNKLSLIYLTNLASSLMLVFDMGVY